MTITDFMIGLSPLVLTTALFGGVLLYRNIHSLADRVMKGRLTEDRSTLQMILASMLEKPGDWLIDEGKARYPREGNAYRILILRDQKTNRLTYSLPSMGDRSRPISGFYYEKINREMKKVHQETQELSVARTLYGNDPRYAALLVDRTQRYTPTGETE